MKPRSLYKDTALEGGFGNAGSDRYAFYRHLKYNDFYTEFDRKKTTGAEG